MTRHPISHCRGRCVGRCVAIVPRARTTRLTHGVVGASTDIHEVVLKRAVALTLATLTLLLVSAGPSAAFVRAGGHGFPRLPVFRGHPPLPRPPLPGHLAFRGRPGFHHGAVHGHGVVVVGPTFWWGPGPWWYYPPPPAPQVVVEPAPVIADQPAPSYWYYCPSAKAYYPTAPTCPGAWIKVPPRAE